MCPGPSSPDGQRILEIFEKAGLLLFGDAPMSPGPNGIGTKDEENGVEPCEKGTFGLLFDEILAEPPPKEVRKAPARRRLDDDVGEEEMENTGPLRPAKGGGDHLSDLGVYTATEPAKPLDPEVGPWNSPPNQTSPLVVLQNTAVTFPSKPPPPSAEKEFLDGS